MNNLAGLAAQQQEPVEQEYQLPEDAQMGPQAEGSAPNPINVSSFNGIVQYNGRQAKVVNGFVLVDGEPFFVNDDGTIVANKNREYMGSIFNGEFYPRTPELIDQLKQLGAFE